MRDERYSEVRERIRTGDSVLWRSHGLVPRLIQLWSRYSHASLIVRLDKYEALRDRVFLVEALSGGLALTLLSARLAETPGRAWLFQPQGLTDAAIRALRASAVHAAAQRTPYDFKGLLANAFGRVTANARRYFCSEHVWHEWALAGVLTPETLTELGVRHHTRGKAPRPGDIPLWIRGDQTPLKPLPAKEPQ